MPRIGFFLGCARGRFLPRRGGAREPGPARCREGRPSDKAAREAAAKARAEQIRAAAEADYKAARARCDTKHGNDKDVCIKVAKAFLADARASASAKATAAR